MGREGEAFSLVFPLFCTLCLAGVTRPVERGIEVRSRFNSSLASRLFCRVVTYQQLRERAAAAVDRPFFFSSLSLALLAHFFHRVGSALCSRRNRLARPFRSGAPPTGFASPERIESTEALSD